MSSPKFDAEIRAKGVARSSFGALAALGGSNPDAPPCPYPGHRPSDWRRTDGGSVVCGVCHPPAPGVPWALIATGVAGVLAGIACGVGLILVVPEVWF